MIEIENPGKRVDTGSEALVMDFILNKCMWSSKGGDKRKAEMVEKERKRCLMLFRMKGAIAGERLTAEKPAFILN